MNRQRQGEILKKISEVLSQFREVVVGYVSGSFLFNEKFEVLNLSPIHFQYQVIKGEAVFSRDEINRIRYEAGVLSD